MKTHRAIVPFAVLLLAGAALAADPATRQISVYGTATIEAAPDQMRWRVTIRSVDAESARHSAAAQNKAVSEVIAFLKRNGVDEREIQTSRLHLGEHWHHEGPTRVRAGYAATTDLVFTLADLARHTDIWLGLADITAVSINSVELDHSERFRLQDEARDEAVLVARAKATRLAGTLGVRLGQVMAIEEDLAGSEAMRPGMSGLSNVSLSHGGQGQADAAFAPGTIAVRARVKVVFGLEDASHE